MKTQNYLLKSLFISTLLTVTTAVSAQNTKEFSLKGFDKIDMSSAFTIDIKYGSAFKIVVDAERAEDLQALELKVSGGTLVAKYKNDGWKWNNNRKRVSFMIMMPNLKQASFSGATKSNVSGFKDLEDFTLKLSGASNADINVIADKVTLDCSGASKLKMMGKATKMNFDVSGASNIDCYGFATNDVDAELSGASSVKISVIKSLNVDASGASSLRYRGSPSVKSDLSGASSVKAD